MSWFSELTSKAEALLEKLDHDAARALQDPDNISNGSRLLDHAKRNIDYIVGQEDEQTLSTECVRDFTDGLNEITEINTARNNTPEDIREEDQLKTGSDPLTHRVTPNAKIDEVKTHLLQNHIENIHIGNDAAGEQAKLDSDIANAEILSTSSKGSRIVETNNHTGRFKLHTGRLKPVDLHQSVSKRNLSEPCSTSSLSSPSESTPVVDDIKASIDQSIREYALKFNTDHQMQQQCEPSSSYKSELDIQTSFYDNQPNVIRRDYNNDSNHFHQNSDGLSGKRNLSSDSFIIDLPDRSNSGRIANQILKQSALKRKSAFNLHQVINRLAKQTNGRPYNLIDDRTKVRLRRAQMRAVSYLRGLNLHLRSYPNLKYWMVGYIIVLQLLVVYVLFFYQSSNSSTYLSSQVKEQQEGLFKPESAGSKINIETNSGTRDNYKAHQR